jgi:hypothetical protein
MHHTTHLLSRRFFVVLAATLAALMALVLSSGVNSAHSQATAITANKAFSGFHDASIALPNSLAPIATLNIPAAGSYVINAKLSAHNSSSTSSPGATCTLTAGGDFDTLPFDVDGSTNDDDEAVAMQVVHTFTAPGSVTLRCTDNGTGDVGARFTKITAVQVAELSNAGI